MGTLEFGLFDPLHGHEFASTSPADVYDEHIGHVQQAEQLGYKYYFIIEHQTASVSHMTAPTVYLTAVAQHTSTIRFGPMIFPLPFYHPIRLAQDVAMLDHLSRGRVDFGMGLGHVTPRIHPMGHAVHGAQGAVRGGDGRHPQVVDRRDRDPLRQVLGVR